jgi:uncharacterized integral membrane protein
MPPHDIGDNSMPKKLILFFVIFAIVLLFVAFNLTNKCDISFGFAKIKDAPVFLTVFASFFLGMICALPFIIGAASKGAGSRKSKAEKPDRKQEKPDSSGKPALSNKPETDSGKSSAEAEYSDRSTYGID